jgi:hypothetical protein
MTFTTGVPMVQCEEDWGFIGVRVKICSLRLTTARGPDRREGSVLWLKAEGLLGSRVVARS